MRCHARPSSLTLANDAELRQRHLEQPFVRLVHLLAHHPDFDGDDHDDDDIATMSKYVEMYIDCVATEQNAPYLYHLALKIKTVRDKDGDEDHDKASLVGSTAYS